MVKHFVLCILLHPDIKRNSDLIMLIQSRDSYKIWKDRWDGQLVRLKSVRNQDNLITTSWNNFRRICDIFQVLFQVYKSWKISLSSGLKIVWLFSDMDTMSEDDNSTWRYLSNNFPSRVPCATGRHQVTHGVGADWSSCAVVAFYTRQSVHSHSPTSCPLKTGPVTTPSQKIFFPRNRKIFYSLNHGGPGEPPE